MANEPNCTTECVLHVDNSIGELNRMRRYLRTALPFEVVSFPDYEDAARYILFGSQIRLLAAIVDLDCAQPLDAYNLAVLVRECHADCPIILTRESGVLPKGCMVEFSNMHVIEKPVGSASLRRALGHLCPYQLTVQ